MGVNVRGYKFALPPPSFSASDQQKLSWGRIYDTNVNLDLYPENTEMIGTNWSTDTPLYDGHNTKLNFRYYNVATGALLFEFDYEIEDPSEHGWQYFSSYNVTAWIGHASWEISGPGLYSCELVMTSNVFPTIKYIKIFTVTSDIPVPDPVICTPGEKKCIGDDLMECNAAGTGWDLFQANAGVCKIQGDCPNWYDDLPGFVLCTIVKAFDNFLGVQGASFLTLILNIQNFLDNFSTAISDFINDPVAAIQKAVEGMFATIGEVTGAISTAIGEWWTTQKEILQRGWDNVVGGIKSWIDEQYTNIGDWFDDQKEILQRGWDNTVSGIKNWIDDTKTNIGEWFNDQKVILQRGWDNTISGFNDWIDTTKSNIGDWWDTQKEILERGWTKVVDDIAGWVDSTFDNIGSWWDSQVVILQRGWDKTVSDIDLTIKNIDIDIRLDIPKIFIDMFTSLLTSNPVVKFLYDMITGSYSDTTENKKKRQEILDRRAKIKEIIERME